MTVITSLRNFFPPNHRQIHAIFLILVSGFVLFIVYKSDQMLSLVGMLQGEGFQTTNLREGLKTGDKVLKFWSILNAISALLLFGGVRSSRKGLVYWLGAALVLGASGCLVAYIALPARKIYWDFPMTCLPQVIFVMAGLYFGFSRRFARLEEPPSISGRRAFLKQLAMALLAFVLMHVVAANTVRSGAGNSLSVIEQPLRTPIPGLPTLPGREKEKPSLELAVFAIGLKVAEGNILEVPDRNSWEKELRGMCRVPGVDAEPFVACTPADLARIVVPKEGASRMVTVISAKYGARIAAFFETAVVSVAMVGLLEASHDSQRCALLSRLFEQKAQQAGISASIFTPYASRIATTDSSRLSLVEGMTNFRHQVWEQYSGAD